MSFLGFSAGLPFLLVFSTLSAWLRDTGVTLSVIGFFSWVGITYSIKVIWAPVVDRLPLPFLTRLLGKRRSWMLLAQVGIAAGLMVLAELDPLSQIELIAITAVGIAFCSATQDIVIDAYRIESIEAEYQAAMAAMYVFGYRVALLVAGAGTFYIAEYIGWNAAYSAMALFMFIGMVTTLLSREPEHQQDDKRIAQQQKIESALGVQTQKGVLQRLSTWFSDAVVSPFADFFVRNGSTAIWILALIALYKMSDITMGVMANPFYLDLGFSKKEIADISKIFGFFMTIFGAALGGVLVLRYGLMKPLLLGAVLVASTNLLFVLLALLEPNLSLLAVVISADNLSGGIATAVFIAYLSSLTNSAYTATQYALFSSLMTLPAKLLGGFSGLIVDGYGYAMFFLYASSVGLPAIILVLILIRLQNTTKAENTAL
ncbi:MAG: AmpG family muropeptide MFS transporter [Gammaproteobacteria bacterium]|nr:AmpG family muropeptide MFS transporter [Gammaproteobacteria bacterium]MBT5223349.1 AmpG family muropeptide MFS transporter [Gammaproteobacteria bacterium]MBT5825261.1 AmpG family muropeptide MFS transporter [Gammaproteobacteria bacterium]MBT5967378.1 AmpG family muropeptide MFS transporter [Gammaproteobacteria bacterium]MBT7435947.1 AmpG family muropeptide MFS transporter [Gammaproteobacteria bacterium]